MIYSLLIKCLLNTPGPLPPVGEWELPSTGAVPPASESCTLGRCGMEHSLIASQGVHEKSSGICSGEESYAHSRAIETHDPYSTPPSRMVPVSYRYPRVGWHHR